ncbi:MAG: porin family protein [Ferruginibacter sp.]|nr:porin family protein [Ferruginibacter sp.]
MTLPSDKELDKLIKEAAGQFESAGAVPNWEGMRSLLDEHLPTKKDRDRKPLLIMLFLFLFTLIGGSYFYFAAKNSKEIAQNLPKEIARIKPVTSKQAATKKEIGVPLKKAVEVSPAANASLITRSSNTQKKNSILKNISKNRKAGFSKITTSPGNIIEENLPGEKTESSQLNETVITTETQPISPREQPGKKEAPAIKNDTVDTQIAKVEITQKPGSDSTFSNLKNRVPNNKKNPFTIALLYAPELTTIKLSNLDKPGSNYGILIGYDISGKLNFQTGIIKSRKNYIADGKDFKTNYPVPPSYKLATAQGYCNMYEIPLNLSWKLSGPKKKLNIYAIGGISSYFMMREYYNLLYTSPASSYNWLDQEDTQKNYWLSLFTIGAGFEKAISEKIRIAASPFVKIPLKGMGAGELKLLSTGINFSLSYRPSFLR